MKIEKNFVNTFFYLLLVSLLFSLHVKADDQPVNMEAILKHTIGERGAKAAKKTIKNITFWQFLSTGSNEAADKIYSLLSKSPKKGYIRAGSNVFKAIDVTSTAANVLQSDDMLEGGEHILNHVGSGYTSKTFIFVAIAAGGGPVSIVLAGVGGAYAYDGVIAPELHELIEDIRGEGRKDDRKNKYPLKKSSYVPTEADKKKTKALGIKQCRGVLEEYKRTKTPPDRVWLNICKKRGIDVYDLCPNNPDKKRPGICGCDKPDIDSDGDGAFDCMDKCPNNAKLKRTEGHNNECEQTEEEWKEEQIEKSGLQCTKYQFIQWNKVKNIPECVCQGGMKLNAAGDACIDERLVEDEPVKSCSEIEHTRSFTQNGYRYCECKRPYVWANKKEQKCVTCDEKYTGAIPGNKKGTCTCPEGTVPNNNTRSCEPNLQVPSIINSTLPNAKAVLETSGLKLGSLKWGQHASMKKQVGTVQNQMPKSGQGATAGGKVNAWIYYTAVPAVVGLSVENALASLKNRWFIPKKGREIEINNKYKWKTIASQSLNVKQRFQNVGASVTLDVYIKPKKKKTISHPLVGEWNGYVKQGRKPKRALSWSIDSVDNNGNFYGRTVTGGKKQKFQGKIKGTNISITYTESNGGHFHKNVVNATLNKYNMTITGNVIPYMDDRNMLPRGFSIIIYLNKKQ